MQQYTFCIQPEFLFSSVLINSTQSIRINFEYKHYS